MGSIIAFPGIEIDLPTGHLLLISDGKDLDAFNEKCKNVSDNIQSNTDFITVEEVKSIFAYIGILEQCFQNYLNTFCKNIFWVLIITQSVQVL